MTDNERSALAVIVGQKMAKERRARKLNQQAIADHIGKSKGTVKNIEAGATQVPFKSIELLADFFDVPPAYFFPGYKVDASSPDPTAGTYEIIKHIAQLDEEYLRMLRIISKAMLTEQKRLSGDASDQDDDEDTTSE